MDRIPATPDRLALAGALFGLLAHDALARGALAGDEAPRFVTESLVLEPPVAGLAAIDVEGDGRLELLVAREEGLEIRAFAGAASPAAAEPLFRLERGGSRTFAWCIAAGSAEGGVRRRDAVWVVRDEGRVQRWEPGTEPIEMVRAGALVLPTGVFSFVFARDLDGDGRVDLALPELGGLRLHFGGAGGAMRKGPLVRHDVEAELELPRPEEVAPQIGSAFSIPAFRCEDQNGDGHPDLAFAAEDRLQFFWSGPDGALPETPTVDVDLGELRAKLRGERTSLLDPGNLFRALDALVAAEVRDLDGDGLADLLLRQGPKVSIFAGARGGIDRGRATQVLKTSGNLLAAFTIDDDGDGRLDLCMLQVADVSIGDVLLWLVVGGKLELDLFTYFQLDEKLRFARSPSRRRRLRIDVPAILGLVDELENNAAFASLGEELARLPVAVDLDGDGRRDDVAALARDGVIELHEGAAPAEAELAEAALWKSVVERYDREVRGRDGVTIPLLGVVDWLPMPGGRLRAAIAARTPTATVGAPDPRASREPPAQGAKKGDAPATRHVLVVLDLDGDGRDDLLIVDPVAESGPIRIDLHRSR